MSTVHGPDGRVWEIQRRPTRPGAVGFLSPGPWQIDAVTKGERRRWMTEGFLSSSRLRADVALALRTGSEGPGGEVAVTEGTDPRTAG